MKYWFCELRQLSKSYPYHMKSDTKNRSLSFFVYVRNGVKNKSKVNLKRCIEEGLQHLSTPPNISLEQIVQPIEWAYYKATWVLSPFEFYSPQVKLGWGRITQHTSFSLIKVDISKPRLKAAVSAKPERKTLKINQVFPPTFPPKCSVDTCLRTPMLVRLTKVKATVGSYYLRESTNRYLSPVSV